MRHRAHFWLFMGLKVALFPSRGLSQAFYTEGDNSNGNLTSHKCRPRLGAWLQVGCWVGRPREELGEDRVDNRLEDRASEMPKAYGSQAPAVFYASG